jgi:integrase
MLRKIGRRYYLDLRIGGKRFRRSLKTDNKFEAIDRFREKKENLFIQYKEKRLTFDDLCQKYLEWAWSSKPASTRREEQRLKKIKEYFAGLGLVYISDISPYHVELLRKKLHERNLSRATINRYLQILRGMFYKAIDWELYSGLNPLKKIRFYKENSRIKSLTKDEINLITIVTKDQISKTPKSPLQKAFADIVLLALNTGMRKGEILNLRWENLKGDEIEVIGKGNKARIIPLNKAALDLITKQPRKNDYVFDIPNRHQQDLFRRTVGQIKKRTGINFHFHLLRHYFATSLIEKGIDLITVSAILGHSKLTTSLIYSHTDKNRMKNAVQLLENP